MIRIVICEDTTAQREYLEKLIVLSLEQLNLDIQIVLSSPCPDEVLKHMQSHPADAAFLDIELKASTNGITLAHSLKQINPDIQIIFTTCYKEYAYQGFNVQALDYLLKPLDPEKIKRTLIRIYESRYPLKDQAPLIQVKAGHRLLQIRPDAVLMIEKQRNRAIITAKHGIYICYESLANLEIRLNSYGFVQAHRGFLVNMNRVSVMDFSRRELILEGGYVCPIGGQYADKVRERAIQC